MKVDESDANFQKLKNSEWSDYETIRDSVKSQGFDKTLSSLEDLVELFEDNQADQLIHGKSRLGLDSDIVSLLRNFTSLYNFYKYFRQEEFINSGVNVFFEQVLHDFFSKIPETQMGEAPLTTYERKNLIKDHSTTNLALYASDKIFFASLLAFFNQGHYHCFSKEYSKNKNKNKNGILQSNKVLQTTLTEKNTDAIKKIISDEKSGHGIRKYFSQACNHWPENGQSMSFSLFKENSTTIEGENAESPKKKSDD